MKKKRTARPGDGNAKMSGNGKIISNNAMDSIPAALTAHKCADREMYVVTASDADSASYRSIAELVLLALSTTALMESEVA